MVVQVVMSRSPTPGILISRFPHLPKSKSSLRMSSSSSVNFSNTTQTRPNHKLPILLFDVMDTIVRDPFYHDVPSFFRMSFKELIDSKHPTAWIEFEKGLIDEMELARKFFKDGRPFDLEGLKDCMQRGYSYLDGVEELLGSLKQNGYEMHAATNYPIWYKLIEDKLKLSTFLSWTFCSCSTGKRKPDANFYLQILQHLDVNGESCIFIDDSKTLENLNTNTCLDFRILLVLPVVYIQFLVKKDITLCREVRGSHFLYCVGVYMRNLTDPKVIFEGWDWYMLTHQ